MRHPDPAPFPGGAPGWFGDRLIGHRGAAALAPENTLTGIARAAAAGVGMVEVDVKLTADGVPILMHDDRLDRTTDRTGPVAEIPFSDLRLLDAGSWFGGDFGGEAVPTLADALSLLYSLGLAVNIEIKPCPGRAAETALRVVDTVLALWPAKRPPPLLSSLSAEALAAARAAGPDLPVAVLVADGPADRATGGRGDDWALLAARLDAAAVAVEAPLLLSGGVARYRIADRAVIAWTVNDGETARRLFADGVDAVITDDPPRVAAALGDDPDGSSGEAAGDPDRP